MQRTRMNTAMIATLGAVVLVAFGCQDQRPQKISPVGPVPESLNFQVKSIDGEPVNLARYFGKGVVVVNIASR